MLHFCKEGMPLLCSLIRPATLQQHSQRACQLLLDQVRLLAGMPASTQTGWSLAMGAANTTLEKQGRKVPSISGVSNHMVLI